MPTIGGGRREPPPRRSAARARALLLLAAPVLIPPPASSAFCPPPTPYAARMVRRSPPPSPPPRRRPAPSFPLAAVRDEDGIYVSVDDDDVGDDPAPPVAPGIRSVPEADPEPDDDDDDDDAGLARGGRGRGRASAGRGRGRGRGRGGRGRGRTMDGRGMGRGGGRSRRGGGDGGRGRDRDRRGGGGRGGWGGRGGGDLAEAKALNRELVRAPNHSSVLSSFVSRGGARGLAGSGSLNSVNFSTLAHRLARFANARGEGLSPHEARRAILVDPRFAVFVCALSEAVAGADPSASAPADDWEGMSEEDLRGLLCGDGGVDGSGGGRAQAFGCREHSNVSWALAKLRFAPPGSVFPVVRPRGLSSSSSASSSDGDDGPTRERMALDLLRASLRVRAEVLAAARERGDGGGKGGGGGRWIPALSQLAGKLLDIVAADSLDMLEASNSQELANLLWAFATAGRADASLFDPLGLRLVRVMEAMEGRALLSRSVDGRTDLAALPKPQEHSNSVWAFATAGVRGPGQRALMRHLARSLDGGGGDGDGGSLADRFKPQELSNTAWGIATLLSKRGGASGASDDVVPDDDAAAAEEEEEDSALRVLRHVARSLASRAQQFKPQEISNTAWAFATVGFGSLRDGGLAHSAKPANDYVCLPSNSPREDRDLVDRALGAAAASALPRLGSFRPQELNNLAWGYARLGYRSGGGGSGASAEASAEEAAGELFEGIGGEILRRGGQFTPQDVGTTLWSLATAEYFDGDVYCAAASRLTRRRGGSFKPQELSNTVWALATAGVVPSYPDAFDTTLIRPLPERRADSDGGTPRYDDPVTECLAAAASELIRRPHEFKEQEIKDVLWGMSRLGVRHPPLFRAAAAHLVGTGGGEGDGDGGGRGLAGFSPQGIGNLAWSYAKQAQIAGASDGGGGGGAKAGGLATGSSGRQAVYETSCLDVGEFLINRLFSRIAESALNDNGGMDRFKAQDLSNTAWAFATLGLLHRGYFDSAAENVVKRLSVHLKNNPKEKTWKGQEIGNLIWAFATLNYRVPLLLDIISEYAASVCGYNGGYNMESIASVFKRQELANIAWSCAVLEQYPKELLELTYTGLLGSADASEVNREVSVLASRIYGDGGLQSQAIMSLFYVQMAVDMEAPHLGLSLPHEFPDGWGENPNDTGRQRSSKVRDDRDTSSLLELSTSRLQIDVSEALRRNGFQHIQEHVIGAKDLFIDRNITGSSSFPSEFLSIDIANLDEKIGVEVDGPSHFITVLDDNSDKDSFVRSHRDVLTEGSVMKMSDEMAWEFISNGRRQSNGPTALKHRLLCHLGWCIIHVPFWEWRGLSSDVESVDEYCRDLLEEVIL